MLKKILNIGIIIFSLSSISHAQYANIDKLNESASCDSTCSIDPNKVQTLSGQNQRLGNCGYGYIGSSLEERVVKPDGTWSDWRLVNRDNCKCSPLTENQEIACPTNQRGQHIQKRDWTCPSVSQGSYTQWVTKSNTCSYYYLNTSTEEQKISCPANQRGTHVQTRNYENWSDGNKKNYTTWTTKSNSCDYYLTAASQTETGSIACPSGYTGTINQIRTYDRWSDGSARNYGAWREISRNCTPIGSSFNYNYICVGTYNMAGVGSGEYCSKESGTINLYNETKAAQDDFFLVKNATLVNPSFFANLYSNFPPRISCNNMGKELYYVSANKNNKSFKIIYYNNTTIAPIAGHSTDPLKYAYNETKAHIIANTYANVTLLESNISLLDYNPQPISQSLITEGIISVRYSCY